MKKFVILAFCVLPFVACDKDNNTPTEPTRCTAAPPTNLQAQVTSNGCDTTTCTASFTALSNSSLARTRWSFPGGSPGESGNFNGTVSWSRRTLPFSQDWTLQGCTCPQADDIDGASCRSTNGRITFFTE